MTELMYTGAIGTQLLVTGLALKVTTVALEAVCNGLFAGLV